MSCLPGPHNSSQKGFVPSLNYWRPQIRRHVTPADAPPPTRRGAPHHARGQRRRLHRPQALCGRRRRSPIPRPVLLGAQEARRVGVCRRLHDALAQAPDHLESACSRDAERLRAATLLESKVASSSIEADLLA
ncbi:hypothetical protein FB451DRAFT_1571421, partial [Mycena latifolia]